MEHTSRLARKVNGTYVIQDFVDGQWVDRPTFFEQPPLNDGDQDPFAYPSDATN